MSLLQFLPTNFVQEKEHFFALLLGQAVNKLITRAIKDTSDFQKLLGKSVTFYLRDLDSAMTITCSATGDLEVVADQLYYPSDLTIAATVKTIQQLASKQTTADQLLKTGELELTGDTALLLPLINITTYVNLSNLVKNADPTSNLAGFVLDKFVTNALPTLHKLSHLFDFNAFTRQAADQASNQAWAQDSDLAGSQAGSATTAQVGSKLGNSNDPFRSDDLTPSSRQAYYDLQQQLINDGAVTLAGTNNAGTTEAQTSDAGIKDTTNSFDSHQASKPALGSLSNLAQQLATHTQGLLQNLTSSSKVTAAPANDVFATVANKLPARLETIFTQLVQPLLTKLTTQLQQGGWQTSSASVVNTATSPTPASTTTTSTESATARATTVATTDAKATTAVAGLTTTNLMATSEQDSDSSVIIATLNPTDAITDDQAEALLVASPTQAVAHPSQSQHSQKTQSNQFGQSDQSGLSGQSAQSTQVATLTQVNQATTSDNN